MQITNNQADPLTLSDRIEAVSGSDLIGIFEAGEQNYLPLDQTAIDPRTGGVVVFNPSRASRPKHKSKSSGCPICAGNSTPIIDRVRLNQGFAFINENLYPAVYPFSPEAGKLFGLHFIQWTSSYHGDDWITLEQSDRVRVLDQLRRLEKHLLTIDIPGLPPEKRYVSIIKNRGLKSGGSIEHDHQQIILSNVLPGKKRENLRFLEENGHPFTQHLLETTPSELIVRDFGDAVLLVPRFMRRPYNLCLVMKDTTKQCIHELGDSALSAAASGWHHAIRTITEIMTKQYGDVSYNVLTHNGPGAGLFFEFLPLSQTNGGFERMGLSICQSSPQRCAGEYRRLMEQGV